MSTTTRGLAAELLVAAHYQEYGCVLHWPHGGQAPYDILVYTGVKFYKIQIKRVYRKKGRLVVNLTRPRDKRYARGDINFIVAIYPPTNELWQIPFSAIGKRTRLSLGEKWKEV